MSIYRRAAASISAFVISAALVGCVPGPIKPPANESPSEPAPTEVTEPADAESAEPPVDPLATVIPTTCDEILSGDNLAAVSDTLVAADPGDPELRLEGLLGPMSWSALSGSDAVLMCGWGIPHSDAVAAVGIGVIDSVTKADLVAALRDSAYVETAVPGADFSFEQSQSQQHQWVDEIVFDGEVLIATVHTISGDFTAHAHQRVRELNPALTNE